MAALTLAAAAPTAAQVDTTRAPDTVATAPPVQAERADTTGATAPMTKSPMTAVLFSIVPGGGQLYNEQYIKSALFIGVGGYFAAQAVRYHVRFLEKADEVNALPEDDSTGMRDFRKREREFYRDNRDLNAAYYLGVTILSMIDAYVGAHLFDFDVEGGEDGLSSRLYIDPSRIGLGVALRW